MRSRSTKGVVSKSPNLCLPTEFKVLSSLPKWMDAPDTAAFTDCSSEPSQAKHRAAIKAPPQLAFHPNPQSRPGRPLRKIGAQLPRRYESSTYHNQHLTLPDHQRHAGQISTKYQLIAYSDRYAQTAPLRRTNHPHLKKLLFPKSPYD